MLEQVFNVNNLPYILNDETNICLLGLVLPIYKLWNRSNVPFLRTAVRVVPELKLQPHKHIVVY